MLSRNSLITGYTLSIMKKKTYYHIFHGPNKKDHYYIHTVVKARKIIRNLIKEGIYLCCDRVVQTQRKVEITRIFRNNPYDPINDIHI